MATELKTIQRTRFLTTVSTRNGKFHADHDYDLTPEQAKRYIDAGKAITVDAVVRVPVKDPSSASAGQAAASSEKKAKGGGNA